MKSLFFLFCFLFANSSSALTDINKVKSVTLYDIKDVNTNPTRISSNLQLAKDTGFNTVWLVIPWVSIEPNIGHSPLGEINDASYSGQINDKYLDSLKAAITLVKNNKMKVMFSIDYLGKGWSPKGVDPDQLIFGNNYTAFLRYTRFITKYVSTLIANDDLIILVHDEGIIGPYNKLKTNVELQTSFVNYLFSRNSSLNYWSTKHKRIYNAWTDIKTLAFETHGFGDPLLWDTAGFINWHIARSIGNGSFVKAVKENLPNSIVGYHYTNFNFFDLRNDESTSINGPLLNNHGFDFVSFAYYDTSLDRNPGFVGLNTYISKAQAAFPRLKIFFGEIGSAVCPTKADCPVTNNVMKMSAGTEQRQSTFLGTNVSAALSYNVGFNVWSLNEFPVENAEGVFGIYRADNSPKSAANVLKNILIRETPKSCTFNSATVLSGSSVKAFAAASVEAGQTCKDETRTCNNGVLSGTYSHSSCMDKGAVMAIVTGGLVTTYSPWVIWLETKNITKNVQFEIYDNGILWSLGKSQAINGNIASFSLPSNSLPSKCNQNGSCPLQIRIVDPATNQTLGLFQVMIPKKQ